MTMGSEDAPTKNTDGETGATPPAGGDEGTLAAVADGVAPAGEHRLSRRATWLAMGAVAVAIGLVWMAPGTEPTRNAGQSAPLHFTLKDMDGVDVKLASFKNKVILVNFWATWCEPCKLEIPDLVEIQKKYPDDLVILGIEIDGSAEMVQPYAKELKINYPVLLAGKREDVQDAYGPLWGIPVSVFIDRNGNIAQRFPHMATKEQFEEVIKGLL